MTKLLLSIDGGGVLGAGPAAYMARLEATPDLVGFIPDAYAGTSVGAILCAARAIGKKWSDILEILIRRAPEIFEKPPLSWRLNPLRPRYDGRGLERVLKDILGASTTMAQTEVPLFIIAQDFTRGHPKVWDSRDGELLWEAVAASASAPTYFPPRAGRADGGLIANNPAVVGVAAMVDKMRIPLTDIWCLSLGTNGDYWKDPKISALTSSIEWGGILLRNPTRGNEELFSFLSRVLLGDRTFRVEPILSRDWALDDISTMGEYASIWEAIFRMRVESLITFKYRMDGGTL